MTTSRSDGELIRVVACVVRRNGNLLVAQRPNHKRHGGLWEFPGGKIEPKESVLDAAARELREELGLVVSGVGPLLFAQADAGSSFVIEFFEVFAEGDPVPTEHDAVGWVPPGDLLGLSLAPSDAAFAAHMAAHM